MNVLKNMVISYNWNVATLDNNRSEALKDTENINKAQTKPDSQKIFVISNTAQSSINAFLCSILVALLSS